MQVINVYEQELFFSPGKKQFRVMADRGLIFGSHQVDFPSEAEATSAIHSHMRREKQTDYKINVHVNGKIVRTEDANAVAS